MYGQAENPPARFSPHRHHLIEVQFAIEGEFSLTSFEPYEIQRIKQGEIIIIPANTYHGITIDAPVKRFCFFVSFNYHNPSGSFKKSDFLYINRAINSMSKPIVIKNELYVNQLKQCEKFLALDSNISNTQMGTHLTNFIIMILSHFSNETVTPSKFTSNDITPNEIARKELLDNFFCTFIEQNLSLDDLVAEMNLCERQVHSLIKKFYNKSYKDLLLEEKMKMARIYLNYTDTSLEDISERLHYCSYSGFYTAFKNYFNCSPNAMRTAKQTP